MAKKEELKCEWNSLREALTAFTLNASGHQGQEHIKPLHHYVACRLVVEGGFMPTEITPHPPFTVEAKSGNRLLLHLDPSKAGTGERAVLGGLKTKNIDVVVLKQSAGPVLAVSMKGTLKSFRNLTNRMEEAVGDCTNLHISYPALVYGFLHVIRANRAVDGVDKTDVCLDRDGSVINGIRRYHDVLTRLTDRFDLRDPTTKYEAVALMLAGTELETGELLSSYPEPTSSLLSTTFFERLYAAYDRRFVYAAPGLRNMRRVVWDEASPAFKQKEDLDYLPRIGQSEPEEDF